MNTAGIVYEERISSIRTLLLFVLLALVFGWLFVLNLFYIEHRSWGIAFGCFSLFFLFYALNYRMLVIQGSEDELALKFGLITWHIPLSNIETCFLDETSLWRIGGAGIHFSPMGGRYRAMFNFLEYPRVVISLKEKKGLVRDIAFSTNQPEMIMSYILGFNDLVQRMRRYNH